jgi:hypothetical protein
MIVPLVVLGVAVIGFLSALGKGAILATSELLVRPAIVAGERTSVDGGGGSSSSTTHYFVTLESRDGERTEFSASDKLAGRVTEGDIGVAYIKADCLIEFERVRV